MQSTTAPLQTLLDLINETLSLILHTSLTVRSLIGRWQSLRSKLSSLSTAVADVSESPHWAENPLLYTLLPNLLSTLQRLSALANQCTKNDASSGKLHMQSDLDMASAALANHLRDLDLLLRSGLLHRSNAIVLSHPAPGSGSQTATFFIRDLFTRLQIGGLEFKSKALESLLKLLESEKSAALVAREGNVAYLIHLLDLHTQPCLRDQAASAVSILAAANDESRRSVFEEGGLGPLLRILESGLTAMKEKAAVAVEALTADPENAWAVSAYGGVPILLESIRSGSPAIQAHSVGAIRNVANVQEIKTALAEEGAVPVLLQLLVSDTTTVTTKEKSANCLAILASSDEYLRALIIQERGLQRLMHLVQDSPSSETLEHVLRAIVSLSGSDTCARVLSSSTLFLIQLVQFINHGNTVLQQISVSLLANLSINVSDGNKRAISSCMGPLVKLMESPKPAGLQESASRALLSILTVRSNRKEFVRDDKSVTRLVQMLDPGNEACGGGSPVTVVAAILAGGSQGCRKRLAAAGAQQHLQRLAEMDVAGAKKALQRLSGNRLKTIFSLTWRE